MDTLLRASDCTAALLPCLLQARTRTRRAPSQGEACSATPPACVPPQILRAANASLADTLRGLRLLLACDSLHQPDQAGRKDARRFVQELLDSHLQKEEAGEVEQEIVVVTHALLTEECLG